MGQLLFLRLSFLFVAICWKALPEGVFWCKQPWKKCELRWEIVGRSKKIFPNRQEKILFQVGKFEMKCLLRGHQWQHIQSGFCVFFAGSSTSGMMSSGSGGSSSFTQQGNQRRSLMSPMPSNVGPGSYPVHGAVTLSNVPDESSYQDNIPDLSFSLRPPSTPKPEIEDEPTTKEEEEPLLMTAPSPTRLGYLMPTSYAVQRPSYVEMAAPSTPTLSATKLLQMRRPIVTEGTTFFPRISATSHVHDKEFLELHVRENVHINCSHTTDILMYFCHFKVKKCAYIFKLPYMFQTYFHYKKELFVGLQGVTIQSRNSYYISVL